MVWPLILIGINAYNALSGNRNYITLTIIYRFRSSKTLGWFNCLQGPIPQME